eukprot:gene7095-7898_t
MEDNKEQRRQDVLERIRLRFSQYHKRQNEFWTRFTNNGAVKEERERHDTQLYQQRILNARANSKPRPKQDQAGKNSTTEGAYPPANTMGDTLILQQLKRRFDETFNQAQTNEEFEDRSPNKTARSDEEQRPDLASNYQQNNVINNMPKRTIQVKTNPNELPLGSSLGASKQKQSDDISGGPASQRNSHLQEKEAELTDGSTRKDSIAEEPPHPGRNNSPNVSSNCHAKQKTSTMSSVKADSNVLDQSNKDFTAGENMSNNNNLLKNGISHISNDGNLTDMLKDWENDFDIFPNISENTSPTTTNESLTDNTSKTTTVTTKARERKDAKNSNNNNNLNSHPLSHSGTFPISSGLQQQNSLGNAPPYPNNVAGGQMTPQVASPMGIGPQIRRYLVNHIQGRGRQQMGPGSFPNMAGMPVRDSMIAAPQAKNPETIAKVQEHLLIKKQMQQQQMQQMARQQMQHSMQQPYQHQTYHQQLMQMAQAAQQQQQQQRQQQPSPSPIMQSMSSHMQQQAAFMQQNMTSPVPSPMSSTPHMNRNPFQFPQDYNAYMNQQKQMPGFDGMGSMQPMRDNENQMPMGFFPKQEPSQFPIRQQMPPSQNNMLHAGMQPNAIRGMFPRDRMFQGEGMPPGQMMQSPLGPPQNFQSQVPKPPPPQYPQNNFSPPVASLERQQLQRSMSNSRNRLSHFSHPEELQNMNMQSSPALKSPGNLPMYQSPDNNMFSPMANNVPSMGSMVQQQQHNTPSSVPPPPDNNFSSYQNFGPPNMNVANAMSSATATSLNPTNWPDEGQMPKQPNIQQLRSNMNPDYRVPPSKGPPSVNLMNRQMSLDQARRINGPFSPGQMDTTSPDITQLPVNSMTQSQQQQQQQPKLSRASLPSNFKQQPQQAAQETSLRLSQMPNESDDLESLLSDPPENFDLVKNLLG